MNSGADHRSAADDRAERSRHEIPHRGEEDRGVKASGWQLIRTPSPDAAEFPSKRLALRILRPGEREDLRPLLDTPTVVTFRHMEHSRKLDELCHEQAEKLSKISDRITRCEVVIEQIFLPQRGARAVEVTVQLMVTRGNLVVRRPTREGKSVATSVRSAFAIARRRLNDFVSRRRTLCHIDQRA